MTKFVLKSFPAMTVLNPTALASTLPGNMVNFELDDDKGYVRVCRASIAIKSMGPRQERAGYEYISTFYFGVDTSNDEYFCNPHAAVLSDTPSEERVVFGYEIGDVVTIEGKEFYLRLAPNNNIALEAV